MAKTLPKSCALCKHTKTTAKHIRKFFFLTNRHFTLFPIHISEPTRLLSISYSVFCLKKKKKKTKKQKKKQTKKTNKKKKKQNKKTKKKKKQTKKTKMYDTIKAI